MIAAVRGWWRARSPREHGLLILLAIVAAPTLLFYGVVRPLDRAIDRAQASRDADARMLADVLLMAGKVQGARTAAGVAGAKEPVDAILRSEAERAGFTVGTVTTAGQGAVLTMDAVRAQPFFAWIAAIRQRRGLIVEQLVARRNGDRTLLVSVRFERAR